MDSDCARKPSHRSHGGVGARSFERAAAPSHAQIDIFSFRKRERSAKKPLTRAIGYDMFVEEFYFKNVKTKEGIVPRVAPER